MTPTPEQERAREGAGYTPGPWAWFGSNRGVYLATPDRGRTYIMGFSRLGMHGAQPTFREGGCMRPASDLVKFAVGDGTAKGIEQGKADPSVYRYDITAIDHPDARLIAAAPELLEALEGIEHFADGFHVYHRDSPAGHALREWIDAARTAIRKARGE